jgi:hypothetical protein
MDGSVARPMVNFPNIEEITLIKRFNGPVWYMSLPLSFPSFPFVKRIVISESLLIPNSSKGKAPKNFLRVSRTDSDTGLQLWPFYTQI